MSSNTAVTSDRLAVGAAAAARRWAAVFERGIRIFMIGAQIGMLWAVSLVANAFVARTHVPIPGNLLALVGVLALLSAGIIRLEWIEAGAGILTRHFGLFFVPLAVGIVAAQSIPGPSAGVLLLALVASAACGIGAAGIAARAALPKEPRK
ncbi:MAG: hypothetical protein NVSMB64_04490 [Candidatus Velthaea sp.]